MSLYAGLLGERIGLEGRMLATVRRGGLFHDFGKIAVDYGTWGIPESFFIDPQGRITYKHVGGIRAALVVTKLDEAAKGIVSAQEGKGDYQPIR